MSVEACTYVKANSPFRGLTFWFHYALADLANQQNNYEIWAGDKTLAEEWHFSIRAVVRYRAELVEGGYLTVLSDKSGPGKPIQYRFEFLGSDPADVRQTGARSRNARQIGENARQIEQQRTPNLVPTPTVNTIGTEVELKSDSCGSCIPDEQAIDALCAQLAAAVGDYMGGPHRRPAVTQTWRRDMRLLVERGPNGRATPEALPPERVASGIEFVFTHLADPGTTGFCWAANIRSPSKLRAQWDRLLDEGRRRTKAAVRRDPLGARTGHMTVGDVMGADPLAAAAERIANRHRPKEISA